MEVEARMRAYVRLIDGAEKMPNGCRLWRGGTSSRGYAHWVVTGKNWSHVE